MEKSSKKIFLVEDDKRLAGLVRTYLCKNSLDVEIFNSGEEAIEAVNQAPPDLIILDIMLPGIDGFEVCRRLRNCFTGPVIMLTAMDETADQIVGLELGADDYIVKPVEPRVLLARIRARLRTRDTQTTQTEEKEKTRIVSGNLVIDKASRKVTLDNMVLDLATNEFDLLWFFCSRVGEVVSRDDIMLHMRGIPYDGLDRTVDIWISRIRKKIEKDPLNPQYIKTVWGQGYILAKEI